MFSFDPYAPAVDADPFPFYKTLRDDYPAFWSKRPICGSCPVMRIS